MDAQQEQREERGGNTSHLLISIMMGNVRLLGSKWDEIQALHRSKPQQNNNRDVWSGMKIAGFMQKDDWIDGCLDRANELNIFFNRFSSETSSASSSPAHSQTS
ncbi:hypothetical protein ILYODFUR_029761 [Ilyodon furcidens]|uniref:Uncharacterized protein n=1 Tax=Ilyodon furcidens TaxID=33524 RepID=A0ABV0UZH4_9TELE